MKFWKLCDKRKILKSPLKILKLTYYMWRLHLHQESAGYLLEKEKNKSAKPHISAIIYFIDKVTALKVMKRKYQKKFEAHAKKLRQEFKVRHNT